MKSIPYGRQFIDNSDVKSVSRALKSDLITTGNYLTRYEKKITKILNSKYSLACSSGTTAIHLALIAINLKNNDIVIMPAINFVASYSLSKTMNAKILLADVDPSTGQMTPQTLLECIKKNKVKKIKAVITMYLGGYPENILDFYKIKKKYNFYLIEDACHALGSKYLSGKKYISVGSCKHSDLAVFSTHPIKTITTGEGGFVTTNNKKFYKKMQLFRSHGIVRKNKNHWDYDIVETGFNYRLSDLNCSLGLTQLNKMKKFISFRKKVYNFYISKLKDLSKFIKVNHYSNENKPSYHLFLITINFDKMQTSKEIFFKYLKKNKILAQYHYIPLYKFSFYKNKKFYLKGSEAYYKTKISLPIFFHYSQSQQNYVLSKIKSFFDDKNIK
jgi:dTDP-4-amino-4,6-dideoxygalactose transaminase